MIDLIFTRVDLYLLGLHSVAMVRMDRLIWRYNLAHKVVTLQVSCSQFCDRRVEFGKYTEKYRTETFSREVSYTIDHKEERNLRFSFSFIMSFCLQERYIKIFPKFLWFLWIKYDLTDLDQLNTTDSTCHSLNYFTTDSPTWLIEYLGPQSRTPVMGLSPHF